MNTKRLDWIDIAKGIGIILVVLGHTLVPQVRETGFAGFLWIFIYNFHMPLFFFLSGYLFEKGLFQELLTLPQGMGGSVLLRKYPAHVHTVYIADRNELADADTPEALAQLEALARQKL